LFENSEVKKATLKVAIKLNKKATLLDLEFNISGNVELSCDTCADLYLQDLNEQFNLIVKFSDLVESTESDEIIILSTREHTLSLAKSIYEFIHLSLPSKRSHADEEECNQDMLENIRQFEIKEQTEKEDVEIDPRWASLKNIKHK
jgi:uncharacterized metal-binding protein YceD (DUF177 family)